MNLAEFFKDQVQNPQAKCVFTDYVPYVSFSVANEILKRDEDQVKKLVTQYKLNVTKVGGSTNFRMKT